MKKYEVGGITIVKLNGNSYERGFQNGTLCKNEITKAIKITYDELLKDSTRYNYFIKKAKFLEDKLSNDFKSELLGISEGSGIEYKKVLMHNLIFTIEMKFACFACSYINKNNELITLRQLDLNINFDSYKEMILYVIKPDKGYAFFTLSIPGFIDSETGMNEKGITLSQNNIGISQVNWDITPIGELTRHLIQNFKSINEINNYLNQEKEYPARLLFCSSPKTASVFEIANKEKAKINLTNNFICVANHPIKIKNNIPSTDSSYERLNYANDFFKKNSNVIDFKKFLEFIRSSLISRKISKTTTNWQSVIFSPSTLNFWIAKQNDVGNNPVCLNEYVGFNLLNLLYDKDCENSPKNLPSFKK